MALFSFPTPFAMRGAGADEGQIRLFEPRPSNYFLRERAVSACASADGGLRERPCGIVGGGDPQTRQTPCGTARRTVGAILAIAALLGPEGGSRLRRPRWAGLSWAGWQVCGLGSAWLATATSGALLQPEREPSAVLGLRSVRCMTLRMRTPRRNLCALTNCRPWH